MCPSQKPLVTFFTPQPLDCPVCGRRLPDGRVFSIGLPVEEGLPSVVLVCDAHVLPQWWGRLYAVSLELVRREAIDRLHERPPAKLHPTPSEITVGEVLRDWEAAHAATDYEEEMSDVRCEKADVRDSEHHQSNISHLTFFRRFILWLLDWRWRKEKVRGT